MRVLLDECTPRPLARELADVNAVHVYDLGWHGRRNGALLAAMLAERFTALVTVDRNLAYQQNIPVSGVVIIVLYRFLQVAFSKSSLTTARRFGIAIEPRERPLVSFGKRELRDGLFRIAKTEHRECHVLLYERSHGAKSGVPRRKEDSVK